MKKLLYVLPFLFCSAAHAATITNAQAVKIVTSYFTDCTKTAISSTTATEISSNTAVVNTTYATSSIAVQNLSATASICCADRANVACSGANQGWMIAPSSGQPNFFSWSISTTQKWYCLASAVSTSAIVCRQK